MKKERKDLSEEEIEEAYHKGIMEYHRKKEE